MELRDYLRMLRRGWPAVLAITALVVGLASLYLALAPKRYDAAAVLFVSADDLRTIDDLQQGSQFSSTAVVTYAEIIDSSTVLGPVASELRPQVDVEELAAMVTVSVREETTLIDVAASGGNRDQVAAVANATAASAARIIPTLETGVDGRPLVRVQQIRPAVEPIRAASPDVKRILVIGLIVGVCLGLGATITAQALDTRIRQADDVRELTEVPLLAVLPRLKRSQRQGLVARDEPSGAANEEFRWLRTNLRYLESNDRRSLAFAAVADDRDRAQVPANLAWSLAQAGRRVLLVDLDLRKSTVGDTVGIGAGAGVADVLAGRADLSQIIHTTQHPRLQVVLSGTSQPSPSDLLSAPMMNRVLRWMEQEFDHVIIHAPPLLSYTDAVVVAGVAGATFVTVTVGRTRADELTTALNALANVGVTPRGLVLTEARRQGRPGEVAAVDARHRVSKSANGSLRQLPAQPV